MKKLFLAFTLLYLSSISLSAQKLHTLSEIMKMLESSEILYDITDLRTVLKPLDQSNNINSNFYYVHNANGQREVRMFELTAEATETYKQAEALFRQGQYDEAQKLYFKTLELAPAFYHVMTYIGQTYEIKEDYKSAIKWYQTAIKNNPIDYMSHWFLADAYARMGKNKKALDEIITAKILNRNNPRIHASFEKIVADNGYIYDNWTFNPQIQVDSVDNKHIRIAANGDWLGYALVEAAWMYEAEYKKPEYLSPVLQAKEGVLALSNSLSNDTIVKRNPEFQALIKALDKKLMDGYIFYEMILVKYPFIAYQINQAGVEEIKKYIYAIRLKK